MLCQYLNTGSSGNTSAICVIYNFKNSNNKIIKKNCLTNYPGNLEVLDITCYT